MPDFAVANLAAGQSMTMAPLGALYVLAALEEAGYSASFQDYALEQGLDLYRVDRIARFLSDADSPFLGISCFSSMLPYAAAAAQRLRETKPETRIVLGGPGPSAVAKELMEAFSAIDFVVYGEGEETAVELVASLMAGTPPLSAIEGLVWRTSDGAVVQNPPRRRRRELDQVHFPAYERVHLADYDVVGLVYARGCPYACTYCDVVSMWKRQNVARSLDNVLAEIAWLKSDFGVRHVAFVDDLFTVDRSRTLEFCREFERLRWQVTWGCTTRIDRVDDALIDEMAAAGCNYVFYGVESGSAKILARVNKVIPFEQTISAVKASARRQMYVHTPLMWGFPFEDLTDFRETLLFGQYLEHCGANVFYTMATPLPATALYEEYRARLAFDPETYSTIIGSGGSTNLADVEGLIRTFPHLFPGFYHFADGQVDEKIRIGRSKGLNLSDIRISSLAAQ
jgi:radical SAM superfamily enzyme YgiQ (UPF0313 family)